MAAILFPPETAKISVEGYHMDNSLVCIKIGGDCIVLARTQAANLNTATEEYLYDKSETTKWLKERIWQLEKELDEVRGYRQIC